MISRLIEHLRNFSSTKVRSRANNINLTVKSKSEDHYLFAYKGSERTPYAIEISFLNATIKTSCSCPYDFGDICKHEVAGLDYIIRNHDFNGSSQAIVKKEAKNTGLKFNEIYLDNHVLTESLLDTLAGWNHDYFEDYFIDIITLKEGFIEATYNNWPRVQQEFNYNSTTQVLTMKCNCSGGRRKLCTHIFSAIKKIQDTYEPNIFSPDYVKEKKEAFLKPYGLSLTDDYQKYFGFLLSINGLEVVEKVKNIVSTDTVLEAEFIPTLNKETADSFLVPHLTKSTELTHGIGFCFSLYAIQGRNFFQFLPFKAKFKKHSTEFASSFKVIDSHNYIDQLKSVSQRDKNQMFTALEFVEAQERFTHENTIDCFRDTYMSFVNLIDNVKSYPFFTKSDRNNLVKKNLELLNFSDKNAILSFSFKEVADFYVLKPKIEIEGKSFQVNSTIIKVYPFFCLYNNTIYQFKSPHEYLYIQRFLERSELRFFKQEYPKMYNGFIKPISEHFTIDTKVYKVSKEKIKEEDLKKEVYLSDFEGEYVLFKLGVQYNGKLLLLNSKENLFNEETQQFTKRDSVFENEFLEEFKELHPAFQEQEGGVFLLTPYELIEDQWLLNASQKMQQKGIAIFGAKDLKSFKFNLNKPTISMGVQSKTDWFDLSIEIKYGKQKVGLKDIKKALLKKSKYVVLNDGSLGLLPKEWLQKFATYFKAGEVKNERIKISNYQFNIIDELYEDLESTPDFLMALQLKKQQLYNLKKVADVAIPKQVKATLRPYQKEGLNWLVFLEENNLGGCLADDMGLGKTLQIITFLAYLKAVKKDKGPHLVIAPTSLIFNWQNEINKFCPSLKTLVYTGAKRKEQLDSFSKAEVILTTYGSVLNDIETLKELEFAYIILDESQAIKNPNSKRYKALRLLKSKNKLALTGTPIENNTFDLYAQINFLNPGLLGSMAHFRKEFSDAIDKENNEDASNLLSRMIHPFLLRRTKKQVATDLPEKSESIIYCEMGVEQRKVYNSFKDKYRDYLLDKINENGEAKSQMYVLEGLTKLRQICNSPELLNEEADYGKSSIKLDLLIENIKTKTTQHKVLVFSQFTSMLQLIKDRLDIEKIDYEYLDGKTRKREDRVSNFQETEDLRVFLISLKAGGVGLNLTAADYVFIVDPWWNPAVESQAIDRSHRIGQTKHVIAYKMICKDTIEEKIMALQENKKQVSDAVIQTDKMKKSFNTTEIKELFS